jgi:hypothetical protein
MSPPLKKISTKRVLLREAPAPIRATVPLIEQYYVAVDRQLKSGFGTYEAAEKGRKGDKEKISESAGNRL